MALRRDKELIVEGAGLSDVKALFAEDEQSQFQFKRMRSSSSEDTES